MSLLPKPTAISLIYVLMAQWLAKDCAVASRDGANCFKTTQDEFMVSPKSIHRTSYLDGRRANGLHNGK